MKKWSNLEGAEQDRDLTLSPSPITTTMVAADIDHGWWFAWWTLWAAISSAWKHSPEKEHGGSVDSRNKQSIQGPASPMRVARFSGLLPKVVQAVTIAEETCQKSVMQLQECWGQVKGPFW